MAAELCHQAGKLLNHQRDQLSPEAIKDIREAIANLRTAMRSGYNRKTLDDQIRRLEETGSRKLIPYRSPGMRENVEVALFAVAIAMSIRTFFVQPMGIPTGSMQPTLYGITEGNLGQEELAPTGVNAWVQHYFAGVSYYHLVSGRKLAIDQRRETEEKLCVLQQAAVDISGHGHQQRNCPRHQSADEQRKLHVRLRELIKGVHTKFAQ